MLEARFGAREQGLADCRKVIRSAANAIRHVHRGQLAEAERLVGESGALLRRAEEVLADHPGVLQAGFVSDAAKEYAEASITLALVQGAQLPTPSSLRIDPVPFLHGLGEAVGELRRRLLDRLRAGSVAEGESLLEAMDAIVDLLAELDFPDGMTSGLRRTTDVARALTERSRSDLTTSVVQERLRRELADRMED